MQNGREGGEGQINVNRQRKMKCQKFWWKWGSHKNCDISGIIQYFSKPFWICIYGWMGYYFLLFFFFNAEYTEKSDGNGGGDFGFSWYFTIFNREYLVNEISRLAAIDCWSRSIWINWSVFDDRERAIDQSPKSRSRSKRHWSIRSAFAAPSMSRLCNFFNFTKKP